QDQRTVECMQPEDYARKEGGDEISLGTRPLHGAGHQLLHAAHLYFNIQEGSTSIPGQNRFQRWRVLGGGTDIVKLFQRVPGDHQAMEFWIMAKNFLPVAGYTEVKFETVGAVFKSQVEAGDGVLRGVVAGAAMSEQ